MNRFEQNLIVGPVEGYKIVNDNMMCRDYQFEVGKRHKLLNEDNLVLCSNGFHFCQYPSGPWAHYSAGRIFKVRAYGVLAQKVESGADYKMVCEEIELYEEVKIGGDSNTGNWNTGDWNTGNKNTGDCNTGNWNTGDCNTGNWNTGDRNTGNCNTGDRNTGNRNTGNRNTGDRNTGNRNTGNWNTGDRNTGDWNTGNWNTGDSNTGNSNTGDWNTGDRNTGDKNTGDCNTGDCNTGNRNTGDCNTGNWNTGDWNTGDWNTGNGNTGDFHSGGLNHGEAPIYLFNKTTKVPRADIPWDLINKLSSLLQKDDPIDPTPFLSIPNATVNTIKALHDAHIAARKGNP